MTDILVNSNVEILGKIYPIRCKEAELESLQAAAAYLNDKMREVKDSGKAINLERIAIITALNTAHQYLELTSQNVGVLNKVNERLTLLQDKLQTSMNQSVQTEFVYSEE